jgi:tetratricopeptide (TPR) repeat protein
MKTRRRSRAALERAIGLARSRRARALAYFRLALFHDNNSRETDAILNYERALRLGLPRALEAQALAWLASSLYKTGRPRRALAALARSRKLARSAQLRKFLDRLARRIRAA